MAGIIIVVPIAKKTLAAIKLSELGEKVAQSGAKAKRGKPMSSIFYNQCDHLASAAGNNPATTSEYALTIHHFSDALAWSSWVNVVNTV